MILSHLITWPSDGSRIQTESIVKELRQWDITENIINDTTVNSQLVISDLQVTWHNGTYICDAHNNNRATSVRQTTIVVVESESLSVVLFLNCVSCYYMHDQSITSCQLCIKYMSCIILPLFVAPTFITAHPQSVVVLSVHLLLYHVRQQVVILSVASGG